MYNRYLQNTCPHEPQKPEPHRDRDCDCAPRRDDRNDCRQKDSSGGGLLSSLSNLLGGEGGLSRLLDDNTLRVLLILLFLLRDDEGNVDHDLLILAGIFLLLGL